MASKPTEELAGCIVGVLKIILILAGLGMALGIISAFIQAVTV